MSRARLVANRDIVDGSIVDADISASAAISASKISGGATQTIVEELNTLTLMGVY